MGLDMMAYKTLETPSTDEDADSTRKEIHYWRKHPDLNGWMQQLYYAKGGTADQFNYVELVLSARDLDALQQAIAEDRLPKTDGFMFGHSGGCEKPDDLAFVTKARDAIARGYTVYYVSSW